MENKKEEKIPNDLIPIQDAISVSGYSRSWLNPRLTFYTVKGKAMVSRSQLEKAVKDYEKPQIKQ